MKNRKLPRSMQVKAFPLAVLLLCTVMLAVEPASANPAIAVERSVIVPAPTAALWTRYGGFCVVADWDPAFGACHFLKGQGEVGTIRHIERRSSGAPIVEKLTATSDTSYSYKAIDGSTEGTLTMRPGPRADTTVVTWQIAAGPTASAAFQEALRSRLGPAILLALETLARLAEGAPPSGGERGSGNANPIPSKEY